MFVIDQETLDAVKPRTSGSKAARQARIIAAIAPILRETLQRYEVNTPLRAAHFLAQIAHESDGLSTTEEYASGAAYEGRRDLGNTERGDGKRFKGRGLIQLTGRDNYRKYGARIGIDLIADPDKAADPATSLVLALEYWKHTRGGLNRFADRDDIITITEAINGGRNGLADRRHYLAKAKVAIARRVAEALAGRQPATARPVLRRGHEDDAAIEALQRLLAGTGAAVAIDGDFGPGTETAVKAFQQSKGLAADGIVGAATWAALEAAQPAPAEPEPAAAAAATSGAARPVLRQGADGAAVEELQQLLTKAGLATVVDGDFGPGTEAKVKAFQRLRGLSDDGSVGPATWAALDAAVAAAAATVRAVPAGG
jgi:putative chitinase